jgi:zinc transporter ZupT
MTQQQASSPPQSARLTLVLGMAVANLVSGGAVSVVADRRNKGRRWAVFIGAAGVGSFFIVLVVLFYFLPIFRPVNTTPSQDKRGPARQGMRLRP